MNVKKLNKYFCALLLIAASFIMNAQGDGKSKNIQTINNKKYYIHKVDKGQSIYAISKIYGIELNALLIENPDAIDGIKAGQELKIPFAKEVTSTTTTKDLENYNTHKVSKGETIFGLCKKYSLTESKFFELNPEAKQGLKDGQLIKVGVKEKVATTTTAQTQATSQTSSTAVTPVVIDSSFNYYTVEQSETMYAISKKFNTTSEDLLKWNPEFASGVKQGQKIKVGQKKARVEITNIVETPHTIAFDTTKINKPKKQSYIVGVFLPFHFAETDLINVDQLVTDKQPFPVTQQITLDFYEGMLNALDSLKSTEFNVTYQLFDVDERDSLRLDKLCNDDKFKSLDLIIGPLYTSAFKAVSACAKKNQIPVVSPLTQQNKILFDNPFASKTTPSNSTLLEGLAEFVADSFRTGNVVIINSGKTKEQSGVKAFKNKYNNYLSTTYSNTKDTIAETRGLAGAKAMYNPSKKNYYVVLSEDEVFLSDFITQLHVYTEKKDVSLIGVKKWISIDNLDPEYLNKFNFLYASPYFIDLSNNWVKKNTLTYRAKYFTDPTDYYYQGYDVAFYYLSALKSYGPAFYNSLESIKKQGSTMNFNFFRPSFATGYDNRSIQVIRYKDYKFVKVK